MGRKRGISYKKLYEEAVERLNRGSRFIIIQEGDRDCEHDFSWEIDSQGGIVGAIYTCNKCFMKIDQTIGERYHPEKIPTDPSIREWRE